MNAVLVPGAASTVSGRVVNLHGIPMTDACVVAYAPNQYALFATGATGRQLPDRQCPVGHLRPRGARLCAAAAIRVRRIADPQSPTTNFNALWWNAVPLSFDQQTQGGPDPIAQGANLVTIAPGQQLTGYDWCFGCTAIMISSVAPGTDSLTLTFDTPGLVIPDGGAQSAVIRCVDRAVGAGEDGPHVHRVVRVDGRGAPGSATGTTTTPRGRGADSRQDVYVSGDRLRRGGDGRIVGGLSGGDVARGRRSGRGRQCQFGSSALERARLHREQDLGARMGGRHAPDRGSGVRRGRGPQAAAEHPDRRCWRRGSKFDARPWRACRTREVRRPSLCGWRGCLLGCTAGFCELVAVGVERSRSSPSGVRCRVRMTSLSEPPANPGRFNQGKHTVADLVGRLSNPSDTLRAVLSEVRGMPA